jgi:anti-sigma factor RsiW
MLPEENDFLPDCGRVRAELTGYVYDEVPPDARAALERHLAGCAACGDELAALRDTQRLLARWETPPASDDPRALARAVASTARAERTGTVRRARLVRWTAALSGVAAACLFTLSVLSAEVRVAGGGCSLSFRLPGAGGAPPPHAADALRDEMRSEMRTVAAEEFAALFEAGQEALVQRCSEMTREELLRLSQAVDYALAQNQETWNARLVRLGEQAQRADIETRRVLTDLASYLPVSHTPR